MKTAREGGRGEDLGARTVEAMRDDDPFAFGARARAVFEDVDAEALREDSSEEEAEREGGASARRLGRGMSVFERVRREKEREREREGRVVAAAKAAVAKVAGGGAAAKTTAAKTTEEAYEFDAFDEPEEASVDAGDEDDDENVGGEDDEDDVMIVDEKASENARPAEDLFDEVAAASPNGKRAKREPMTLTRAAPKKRNEPPATAPIVDETSTEQTTTSRRETSTSASATAAKKKKVTLEEFAGEDDRGFEYGDDNSRGALPQSGAQLADMDEAQYAISGLAAGRDVKEKIRSVGVLVNLLSNQRTRRMLTSYGVHTKIIQAAQEAALSAHAPKTLHFGCAAVLFLCGGELRASSSGIMLGLKSASSLRAILRANRANDEAAYAKTNGAIRECLKSLKFLPHEAKDPQTLALLVAHQSLKGEQDALLASGSGPGSTNSDNSFRNVLASQGAILATCELIASAASTLKTFGAAGFEQVTSCVIRDDDADACDASTEQEAARALARLFRCSRVLECASFESRETCEVISSSTLSSKSNSTESSDISLVRVTAAQQEQMASEDSVPRSAPIDIRSPSPIKSRVPGGITMTPPSARRGFASTSLGAENDDNGDDAIITDMSPLSPPITAFAGRGIATQWLAENAQMQTPVKGSSANARTAVRALVDIIPTLGAMTTASVIKSKRNDVLVDRLRVRYDGSIAVDARVAVGALKSTLCVLTNTTNENEDGCAAVVGEDYRGLGHIASLILWLALSIEGFSLRDPRDRKRSRTPTDDSGSTLLCAALVLTINIVESDPEAANFLRGCKCDLAALRSEGSSISTTTSFPEALTVLYLQSGGADGEPDDESLPGPESVTADMIKSCSEDLILQAYSGLLLAFLIEEQPMLRAEVVSRFPPSAVAGESPLAPLADTLERFHAFHESVNTLSAKSSERLVRVVRWLR